MVNNTFVVLGYRSRDRYEALTFLWEEREEAKKFAIATSLAGYTVLVYTKTNEKVGESEFVGRFVGGKFLPKNPNRRKVG